MKNISIVGSTGLIGRRLLPFLRRTIQKPAYIMGTYCHNNISEGVRLDVTDDRAIRQFIIEKHPEIIIWLSGTKDVKRCETSPDYAYQLNTRPIKTLIDVIKEVSPTIRVIYISTDYVFEGSGRLYKPSDVCSPRTIYGRSKYLAEQALQASIIDYLILRTSAVMSREGGLLAWFISQLATGKPIELYSNTYFSPTPIEVLNRGIFFYMAQPKWSNRIVHVAGPRTNRFQFGRYLAKSLGIKSHIISASMVDFKTSTFQADLSLQASKEVESLTKVSWKELVNEAIGDSIY